MPGTVRYTFGDDNAAAGRMGLVAAAYEPTSRALLATVPPGGSVVDLGCGPGHSTLLLADVCRPTSLHGLDASSSHLDRARRMVPRATFTRHDVTTLPLPTAPADVLYARLVLAHLPDPLAVVAGWRSTLAPDGVLVVEDLEAIEAPVGPLREYDVLSAEVVGSGGGPMYAGAALAPLGGELVEVRVPGAEAARIYRVNVLAWHAEGRPTGHDLPALAAGLDRIAAGEASDPVTWVVRQLTVGGAGRPGFR